MVSGSLRRTGGFIVALPFSRRTNIALGVAYLVLLIALSWVNSQAANVEAAGLVNETGFVISILR